MSKSDAELEKTLKAARAPKWSEAYWQDFSGSVTMRLKELAKPERHPQLSFRFAWRIGIAVAAMALVLGIFGWRGHERENDSFALLQNEKVVDGVLAMFPHRVRAIVQDEHGLKLVLSESSDVPASQPLWVKLCDGRNCFALVTFSGQELQLFGKRVQVLADARGGVILVGERLLWSSDTPDRMTENLRIQARPVGRTI